MGKLTWYNIAISLVVSWGGFAYGYGFAVFVTSIGQPGFYEYFHLDRVLDLNPVEDAVTNSKQPLPLTRRSKCRPPRD